MFQTIDNSNQNAYHVMVLILYHSIVLNVIALNSKQIAFNTNRLSCSIDLLTTLIKMLN